MLENLFQYLSAPEIWEMLEIWHVLVFVQFVNLRWLTPHVFAAGFVTDCTLYG
jgi:hypothetical protein